MYSYLEVWIDIDGGVLKNAKVFNNLKDAVTYLQQRYEEGMLFFSPENSVDYTPLIRSQINLTENKFVLQNGEGVLTGKIDLINDYTI
jgi:hypothetical protein